MNDKFDFVYFLMVVVTAMIIICILTGHIAGLKKQAINVGAAYYHPITANFTWKTNLVEINK